MSQGFNVNGASSVGVCDGALQPGQLLPSSSSSSIPGHLGVTGLQQCNSSTIMALTSAADSHPSPGLGSMPPGLPASSPRSFSSTGSLSSLVRHQVGLPNLSQLEQQETQLHQHLQQTGSVAPASQLLQQQQQQQQQAPQSVQQQQDQVPQISQQQAVAQLITNGPQSAGTGQQMLGGGTTAPAQQVVPLGGSQQQQQQTLVRVKPEQQQLTDQSTLHHLEQQQLLIPKREMKSEDGIAHQVGANGDEKSRDPNQEFVCPNFPSNFGLFSLSWFLVHFEHPSMYI
jgi:hypothetical protein